nr:ferritin-like protein [uncultured Rhodopila sp.]
MMPTSAIQDLHELYDYLDAAIQLEHATLPPYLVALYSVHPGTNPDAVQILRVVAVEEMLHLTIAANVLNAVGGKPDLNAPGFVPAYPTHLPSGETDFEVGTGAFTPAALETFLKIERPGMSGRGARQLIAKARNRSGSFLGRHPRDSGWSYYSIGDFYNAIRDGLRTLEEEARKSGGTIFTGEPSRQVTSEYYYSGGGKLRAVTDLDSALAALELVIEQGEGEDHGIWSGDGELSHYYRFQQLQLGRYYEPGDMEPGRPTGAEIKIDWDAVYPVKPNIKLSDFPPKSELLGVAKAFNDAYRRFLDLLTQSYNGRPELLLEAVPFMFSFRNMVNELIRNPLPGGGNAAPTFEV